MENCSKRARKARREEGSPYVKEAKKLAIEEFFEKIKATFKKNYQKITFHNNYSALKV